MGDDEHPQKEFGHFLDGSSLPYKNPGPRGAALMDLSGQTVKQFKIISLLGKGGMGQVYLAQDQNLGRKVAIKFLSAEFKEDKEARARFVQEARAAASLDHPFICKIYEAGEEGGHAFMAMEYIEGKNLNEKMKEETFSIKEALQIVLEVAEALEIAHNSGIVHRDLKPANIMITPQGHVKVMDFGLAKRVFSQDTETMLQSMTQAQLTQQGTIVGTLAYMSPEQARGDNVDQRSDIFALGVILHELVAKKHPFLRMSAIETLSAVLRDPPPSIKIKQKKLLPALNPILKKAMAKDVDQRYQKVGGFVKDVHRAQRLTHIGSRFLYPGWQAITAAFVIVALIVTITWVLSRRGGSLVEETVPKPVSVILAAIENKTGDPVFDGVMEKVLNISLDGASFMSVFDRGQAQQLAGFLDPGSEGELTVETAQLISRREAVNAVISASIEPKDSGYLIRVWAVDPIESEKIAEVEQTIKAKSDVLNVADYLAAKLRDKLVEIPEDSTEAIIKETFTTTSLEAMKAYTTAQELDASGKQEEAIKEFLRAIDHDPNFGRAYAGLGATYYNLNQIKESEHYYEEALKRIDQMTDREKFRTRGGYYLMKKNYQKAVEEYANLVSRFPKDAAGRGNLAFAHYLAYNMPKAYQEGLKAIELIPGNINAQYNLGWYAMAAGDFKRAEQAAVETMEIYPSFEMAYVLLALSQLARDEFEAAVQTYQRLESLSSEGASLAATGLADLAVYQGRLEDAFSLLQQGINEDVKNELTDLAADKYSILASIYIKQEKNDLAKQAAEKSVDRVAESREGEILFTTSLVYIGGGEAEKARFQAGQLGKKIQTDCQAFAKLIGGYLSLKREDVPNAIRLFQEAQALVDTWLGRFALGRAYLEAEEYTAAYAEFEQCQKRRGEAMAIFLNDWPTFRYLDSLYYYLGRAQEGLGSEAASESYRKFLDVKKDVDWNDPLVEDALTRLGS